MTSPYTDLNTAIFNKLKASTALVSALGGTAIYYMQAPEAATVPYVVYSYQSGSQENINPSPLHSNLVYIRCYDTNAARAGTVDGLIDGAIDGQALTITGSWVNYYSAREEDITLVETPTDQIPIYSIGALYRINLDK